MVILTQARRWTDFLGAEASGKRSRENITIAASQTIVPGQVLGRVDTGTATAGAVVGTGNGAMGSITLGPDVKPGNYTVRITSAAANAGGFNLIDPDGDVVGSGNVASAFTSDHLSFTLADGSTDFTAGTTIPIAVAVTASSYKALNLAGTDGSEVASAIALYPVETGGAETKVIAAVVRDCEVNGGELTWPAGITVNQKATATRQLADLGVIVRPGV